MDKNKSVKNLVVKVLFIIGIIIVVFLLTLAMMKVIPAIFSSFANVGDSMKNSFKSTNSLNIKTDKTNLRSGELVVMDWKYEPAENGVYEVKYSCADNLSFELGTAEGNKGIKCNTVYKLNPVTQTVSMLPIVSKENVLVETTFDIRYVNVNGEIKTNDEVELTIVNRGKDELVGSGTIINAEIISPGSVDTKKDDVRKPTAEEITPNIPTTNTTPVKQPVNVGRPDLRIYNVQTTDGTTVVFSVSNIGSSQTGSWYFNYAMPDGDVQLSPVQPSLKPGEAIRYTIRLSNVPRGNVAIALDPNNRVIELSEINNIAVVEIKGDGGAVSNNSNRADLEIKNLATGRMSGSKFVEDYEVSTDDVAAIRFNVTNIGGKSTGTWKFEANNVPYSEEKLFESSRQTSLLPNETREIIVKFDRPDVGRYDIKVEIDPRNEIKEDSVRNNYDSVKMRVLR